MQKLKVLIEENTVGSVHPVEVVADAPIATLVPALVDALQLPHTDLFGKQLVYMLRSPSGGAVFPEYASLLDSGVMPGERLALDSYVVDGSVAALEKGPVWQSSLPPGVLSHMNMYGSVTLPDAKGFVPETDHRLNAITGFMPETGKRLTPASGFMPGTNNNSATIAVPVIPPIPVEEVKRRRSTRRGFLLATGAALGLGGAGLAYAAYQRSLGATQPVAKTKTTHTTNVAVQKAPPKKKTNVLPTTAKTIITFQGHQQIVRTVGWSPENMQLASGSDDTTVLIWDTEGKVHQTLKHPAPVHTLSWAADGQRLVTGAGNQVAFFSTQTGKNLGQNQQHTQPVNIVAWAGKGMHQIMSVGADKRAYIWNDQTYQLQTTYAKHTAAILAAAWSSNGQAVATGSQGGLIHVWNAANGQDLHGFFKDAALPIHELAFSPTGTLLAAACDDGMVRLWNGLTCINNGVQCMDIPQRIPISQKPVRTLAWSPDGRMLAIGTVDGIFSLFAFGAQKPHLFTLQQKAEIHSISWSPDSTQLALAIGDTVVLMELM